MSEKNIFTCYSYYKPLADKDASLGVANVDLRDMAGFIKGNTKHCYTLHKSSWPHGFREEHCFMFSYFKSVGTNYPGVYPVWTPGAGFK